MLLAKVEQTDEKLIITPMRYLGWDAVIVVAWMFLYIGLCIIAAFHISIHGVLLKFSVVSEIMPVLSIGVSIAAAIIRPTSRTSFWQSLIHTFLFNRNTRIISRDGKVLGHFGDVLRVALETQESGYGSLKFRLVLVMSNRKEQTIVETLVFSFVRMFDHNPFAVSHWKPYPDDNLPTNATEYELVMLANLIHDYLGLQGPRPCKNLTPFPSPIPNKTY